MLAARLYRWSSTHMIRDHPLASGPRCSTRIFFYESGSEVPQRSQPALALEMATPARPSATRPYTSGQSVARRKRLAPCAKRNYNVMRENASRRHEPYAAKSDVHPGRPRGGSHLRPVVDTHARRHDTTPRRMVWTRADRRGGRHVLVVSPTVCRRRGRDARAVGHSEPIRGRGSIPLGPQSNLSRRAAGTDW